MQKTTGNAPMHILKNVLNLNERIIYVIAREMYLHLCFGDCKQIMSVSLICWIRRILIVMNVKQVDFNFYQIAQRCRGKNSKKTPSLVSFSVVRIGEHRRTETVEGCMRQIVVAIEPCIGALELIYKSFDNISLCCHGNCLRLWNVCLQFSCILCYTFGSITVCICS